jgi:hypothetical protein
MGLGVWLGPAAWLRGRGAGAGGAWGSESICPTDDRNTTLLSGPNESLLPWVTIGPRLMNQIVMMMRGCLGNKSLEVQSEQAQEQ